MYKLIIVDDEETIRTGLKDFVDWNATGFEVIDTFEDGSDAIEFLKDHHVDAIFTDIQMYQVSGIELAKYVREHMPSTRVVALSNYRDFDYIKQSMQYDICDYILKPVDIDEVMRTFRKVCDILQKENTLQKITAATDPVFYTTDEYKQIKEMSRQLRLLIYNEKEYSILLNQWYLQISEHCPHLLYHLTTTLFDDLNKLFVQAGFHIPKQLTMDVIINKLSEGNSLAVIREIAGKYGEMKRKYTSDNQSNTIEDIKEYIRTHLDQHLLVEEIARHFFLNPSYLSREFKKQTGMNITRFILDNEMQLAMKYMQADPDCSVKKIAARVGYEDVRYFHRVFKQYTGSSVKNYLRKMQDQSSENGDLQ